MSDSSNTNATEPNGVSASGNGDSNSQFLQNISSQGLEHRTVANNIKNITITDLLNIVNKHQQLQKDIENKSQLPLNDASLEDKISYALKELEFTQRQIAESKIKYQSSILNLQKATDELQQNNQILLQNKLEIQENKIESQRTRIELNSLKQQTIDEIKNLNKKIDLLLNSYNENFNTLHKTVVRTLTSNLEKDVTFHKPKSIARKRTLSATPEGSPSRGTTEEPGSEFRYKLAKPLTNVRQIWEEYEYGLYGQPSVKSLDQKFKNRWRYKGENTTYLRRRKIFLAIESCIKMGVTEDDAIEALEKLRVDETGTKRTMAWLFDNIPDGFPESYFGLERRSSTVKSDINEEEQDDQEEEAEEDGSLDRDVEPEEEGGDDIGGDIEEQKEQEAEDIVMGQGGQEDEDDDVKAENPVERNIPVLDGEDKTIVVLGVVEASEETRPSAIAGSSSDEDNNTLDNSVLPKEVIHA